ncbi:MAG: desulfoferrodoxin [Clostridiales bacterium]|nr:desulfoferrodoxin [Clostridiales bacterium]
MFMRCEICGNIVGVIEDNSVTPECCGQNMTLLTPNTVDAAQEKHVPVGVINGNKLSVQVGSTLHPMIKEHHIAWIAIAQGRRTQRVQLDPTGSPTADFYVDDSEPITMYEYCNLHGLWAADM